VRQIRVIDSHTGGEPTRVVVSGGPPLGNSPMTERLECFREHFDHFRSAIVNEPRGSNATVGALLCEPVDPACCTGVIFFNNVGYLGMCGHGTIGLGVTLRHLGLIELGTHRVETPVGSVEIEVHENGEVTVANVASYRFAKDAIVNIEGAGAVKGDVAWGGNWFFITEQLPCELELRNLDQLIDYTWRIRQALSAQGTTGAHGAAIDHIEISGPPKNPTANSRNFVLCPGKEYDRSPCGTGASAKVACLREDGKLAEGEVWRQESIIGSIFEASISIRNGNIYPSITGSAFITAETKLILDEDDPFCWGIRA
jgi:4-hydroxyproline epimerase